MKPIRKMTIAELAAYVQTHLRAKGIEVVLSGGACVSVHSRGKYMSEDVDLVDVRLVRSSILRDAMSEIGFRPEGRHFVHPEARCLVEFPPGPLAVGAEPVKRVDEHILSTGTLRILSPTDCVKDRLAGYYHWGDRQCLEQAILVARAKPVDLDEVKRWSKAEAMIAKYREIEGRLRRRK